MDERLAEIETLYRSRYPVFLRTATAILGDPEAARDAVQDAFAAAVRKRRDFRGSGSLEGWLWRILVNTARSGRRARPPLAVPDVREPPAVNGTDPAPEAHAVRVLLAALPERQRLIVFLRYFADLDYDGIAAALDIRPGTVGATLNSVHAALRRRLEEVPR